jgi:hypothetical protein
MNAGMSSERGCNEAEMLTSGGRTRTDTRLPPRDFEGWRPAEYRRVFAVVGVTHAVMLEPALLAAGEQDHQP